MLAKAQEDLKSCENKVADTAQAASELTRDAHEKAGLLDPKREEQMIAAAVLAVVAFSLPLGATAQDDSRPGAAGALLEEIVTTARKKSDAEAVQDVPVAVTAFGAEQIDALFVKKITDLSYLVPNVQMEEVGSLWCVEVGFSQP